MSLEIQEQQKVPLQTDADGVIRVAGTRVTLETVAEVFQQGATAEEIVQQYPSLALAEVYAVLAFYLARRPQVDAYLKARKDQRESTRQENEGRHDPEGIRERLLARRS